MHYRLALAGALLTAACGGPANDTGDTGGTGETDTRPPALISVSPASGSAGWLHEPVRFTFDEPIAAASAADARVTASIAGVPVAATVALEAPDTLAVTVAPAARGLGTLDVRIEAELADAAGNRVHEPLETALELPAWSATSGGPATAASPSLTVDSRGRVLAAWTTGDAGARRVVVRQLDPRGETGGGWLALGGELGSDASSPAIALDAAARPLVAWIDGGIAHTARWDGATWSELASPGAGGHVGLAAAPGSDPVVAVFGAVAAVRQLRDDSWQPVGSDTAIASPLAGEPALAVGETIAIGWIDAGGRLRVYRHDDRWTAIAPVAVTAPPSGPNHLSLATRGAAIAVAWDAWAGSLGVVAARLTGGATTWTSLGHALDVDAAGDASGPAIAIDASGAPVIAWTELIDGNQRGVVARYTDRWTIVGGTTFLPDPAAQPSPVRLALAGDQVPVVSWTADGAIGVARFNGPAIAPVGPLVRRSTTGCAISPAAPPPLLMQTGCFSLLAPGRPVPHPGLVPYDVVSELWSDGAHKRRWIALPDGAPAMTESANGAWLPPVGTILLKEFAIDTTPGDPATRRVIETRLLVRDPQLGWQGVSYRWRDDGSDATLQPDETQTIDWPMDDGSSHPHVYPSRTHCISCHDNSYGPLLGVRAAQLQRWYDYDGVIADQIPTLAALGIGPLSTTPPLVSPHDPSETVEHRMRGYMAANCAHCHNPQLINIKDLRFETPLAETRLCEAIVPGSPARSVVYQKVSSRPGMPPRGTASVDPFAVSLLGSWITQMTSSRDLPARSSAIGGKMTGG